MRYWSAFYIVIKPFIIEIFCSKDNIELCHQIKKKYKQIAIFDKWYKIWSIKELCYEMICNKESLLCSKTSRLGNSLI